MRKRTDPRGFRARMITAGHGENETILDLTDAVLLEESHVCLVEQNSTDEPLLALELTGRVNHRNEHASILYLTSAEGVAQLVGLLIGQAALVDKALVHRILDKAEEVMEEGQ